MGWVEVEGMQGGGKARLWGAKRRGEEIDERNVGYWGMEGVEEVGVRKEGLWVS